MKTGTFITFEGGEGSGKTLLITKLEEELISKGFKVMKTREPGGVPVAERIRNVIMSDDMDAMTEAMLFASARREHLVKKVVPALEDGYIVLCDRFVHSSLVYQGISRGLGIDTVNELNKLAIGDNTPDLTLILDVESKLGLRRIKSDKSREVNRLDKETLAFHESNRQGYLSLIEKYPEQNIMVIDASQTSEKVFKDALIIVEKSITK